MKRAYFAMVLVLHWAVSSAYAETRPVTVTADRVNLRAAARETAEVVGQVNEGTVLASKSIGQKWVEIVPPETVNLWVHRDFVHDGIVATRKLNVRAGPGINFSVVGRLKKGTHLKIRGEFSEWLKIAPPPECSLWVSSRYVKIPSKTSRRSPRRRAVRVHSPVAVRAPATTPSTIRRAPTQRAAYVPSSTRPSTATHRLITNRTQRLELPETWKLVPLEGQGRRVEHEGILRSVGFLFAKPTKYRLVQYVHNQPHDVCFLWGDDTQLSSMMGEYLIISGREYWLRGVRQPVLVVERIIRRTPSSDEGGTR